MAKEKSTKKGVKGVAVFPECVFKGGGEGQRRGSSSTIQKRAEPSGGLSLGKQGGERTSAPRVEKEVFDR